MNRPTCSLVVMGVSGAGKTEVGRALAASWGAHFIDADDYHPQTNIEKMRRGEALDDDDRAPWVELLSRTLRELPMPVVLACSALRQKYRDQLGIDDRTIRLLYLRVPKAELEDRLERRVGHFAGRPLLQSQLETLEEPTTGLTLDGTRAVPDLVHDALGWLRCV